MKTLTGKVAVVTGAASGIGKACAEAFAAEGMNVVASDVNEAGLAETVRLIEARGGKALAKKADVSKAGDVKRLVEFACRSLGGIDLMMNNAGVGIGGEVRDLELSDWKAAIDVNLWGPIHGMHYALPKLIERGGGHIVNTASGAGLMGIVGMGPYCATKFAVVGISECLRGEAARHNVGVTVLCPGIVKTAIFETSPTPKGMKEFDKTLLTKKYGMTPEKVARAVMGAVKRNKFLLVVTPEAHLFYNMKRLLPRAYYAMGPLMGRGLDRMREDRG